MTINSVAFFIFRTETAERSFSMKASSIRILAIILCIATLFFASSCSFIDSFKGTSEAETTTEAPKSVTAMPEGQDAVLAYFNTLVDKAKASKPKVKWSSDIGVDNGSFECANETLKAALPTVAGIMLKDKGTSGETVYGDSLLNIFPVKGNEVGSLLKPSNIVAAEIKEVENTYEIDITLADESDPTQGGSIVGTIFEIPEKSEILSEFSKVKDYVSVDDYIPLYTGCTIHCVVDRLTDNVIRVEYNKRINITTTVVGQGTLVDIGVEPLTFTVTGTDKYEFDWVDPNAPTTAAE